MADEKPVDLTKRVEVAYTDKHPEVLAGRLKAGDKTKVGEAVASKLRKKGWLK